MALIKSPAELEEYREKVLSNRIPGKRYITLCSGSACHASGSKQIAASIEEEIKKQGLNGEVEIRKTGCHGFCERGPIIVIYPEGICYLQIKPEDVPEIISETIKKKKIIDRLLYTDPNTKEKIIYESGIPFYKNQKRLIFGSNISIDPKSIDDYLALGGYSALAKVLNQMTRCQYIAPLVILERPKGLLASGRCIIGTNKGYGALFGTDDANCPLI